MVWEAELTDREITHRFLIIPHVLLGTEIVDFNHFAVMGLEKVDKISLAISICGGKTCSWEAARNYTISNVRQIQIPITHCEAHLFLRYHLTHFISYVEAPFA